MKTFTNEDRLRVKEVLVKKKKPEVVSEFIIAIHGTGQYEQYGLHDTKNDTWYFPPKYLQQTKQRLNYLKELKVKYEKEEN